MSSYISSFMSYFSGVFFPTPLQPVVAAASKASSSTKVAVHTGEKLFKVVGHSLMDEKRRISECFNVGGHDWAVCYYPNGGVDAQFSSVFLVLMSDCKTNKVRTSFTFSLQHPAESPAATARPDRIKFHMAYNFLSKGQGRGRPRFVSKHDLTALGYLKDDCLLIKCSLEVTVVDRNNKDNGIGCIVVPPSTLNTDLRSLFERGHKADLTVKVIGSSRTFNVHGCMVAARSPVFRAQLCGSMMESKHSSIDIDDMDADVFELLLYYIYNDCLPGFMDDTTEEAANMAQHLFVAADRYGVERLKLICQTKLSQALDVDTVGFILDLAEQYSCFQLKAHGLKYIDINCKTLGSIEETQGFKQLKFNHPLLARDILAKLRRCRKNEQQRKKNKNKPRKK